jgi:hypothetical protein
VQTYVPSSEVREPHPLAINLEVARESGVRKGRVGPTFPTFPPTWRLAKLMGREPVAARSGGSNQAQSTPVASSVGGRRPELANGSGPSAALVSLSRTGR